MEHNRIIELLDINKGVFEVLLKNKNKKEYLWKEQPSRWCLLEVVCHLYDEECEDFRMRVKTTLEHPGELPPQIDPIGWVTRRNYLMQDYDAKLQQFITERSESISFLQSLKKPEWQNSYKHKVLGELSAQHFLFNWLAHDYMHIRQINRIQYQYLQFSTKMDLTYAGTW